jgi:hypothetical protein
LSRRRKRVRLSFFAGREGRSRRDTGVFGGLFDSLPLTLLPSPPHRCAGGGEKKIAFVTLEAMKMERVQVAGIVGTVSAIDVAEGEQVTTGKIVVEIEADPK